MTHMWTLPCNFIFQTKSRNHLGHVNECAQIGRFIALWATFQSRWQQLFCPNCTHCEAIFVKVSKSFIFLVKSFWATFTDIWQFFSGHTSKKVSKSSHKIFLWHRLRILPNSWQERKLKNVVRLPRFNISSKRISIISKFIFSLFWDLISAYFASN